MRIIMRATAFLTLVFIAESVMATKHSASASFAPPLLAIGKDAQGRALPFGIPPYYTPDTPLGSGPYKAIMATDPTLPEHVMYFPANVDAAGKLPIIAWGNGACIHAGNRFRGFSLRSRATAFCDLCRPDGTCLRSSWATGKIRR